MLIVKEHCELDDRLVGNFGQSFVTFEKYEKLVNLESNVLRGTRIYK